MPNISNETSHNFSWTRDFQIEAVCQDNVLKTKKLPTSSGNRYNVCEDSAGITMHPTGKSSIEKSVQVCNTSCIKGGINANLYLNNKLLIKKHITALHQTATFIIHDKLYWGISQDIQEGKTLSLNTLNQDSFFELDMANITNATIILFGNSKDGYQFLVENE